MRKQRVSFLFPNLEFGGAEKSCLSLIDELKNEYDIELILFKKRGPLLPEVPKGINVIFCSNKLNENKIISTLKVFIRLFSVCMRRTTLVAGLEYAPTYFSYFIGRITFNKMIFWVHSTIEQQSQIKNIFHRSLSKWIYRSRSPLIFVSKYSLNSMTTFLRKKHPENTWFVVRNITKFNKEVSSSNQNIVEKYFLVASRHVPEKQIHHAITAFADFHKSNPTVRLRILGTGPETASLKEYALKLRIQEYVDFSGYQTDVQHHMKSAIALLLTSAYEGLPVAIQECLAVQTPVISYNSPGGIGEIIDDNCGTLVELNNTVMLTDIMKKYSDGIISKKNICLPEEYTKKIIIKKWKDLLN